MTQAQQFVDKLRGAKLSDKEIKFVLEMLEEIAALGEIEQRQLAQAALELLAEKRKLK